MGIFGTEISPFPGCHDYIRERQGYASNSGNSPACSQPASFLFIERPPPDFNHLSP